MEFYIVAIIFIACMIMLALLIHYCQEYRNRAKYSITGNQRDISAIALAIGAPTLSQKQYESNNPSSGIVTLLSSTHQSQPPPPDFVINRKQSEQTNLSLYPTKPPSLQDYQRPSLIVEDDYSDSGSSSSSRIYFAPNTAAYSIAKRISISTNADAIARKQSIQSALLLAKRLQELQQLQECIILEKERNNYQAKNRRNTFHCISEVPLLKRDKRSKSPCTPLRSNSASSLEEASACVHIDERGKHSGQDKKCKSSKELAPPKRNENISYPKPNNVTVKKGNNKDRVFYVSTETSHNNSAPGSLDTVDEEE